ncbi:alpha-glucan family phosphorylase [Desulfobulbus oligotrophicus]|uniref:glycogen phosphorylase n=1 Tax=Desulfobulbus oligotrophicus TaxID=1909699 RepID=A0A7T5VCV2_9BACT|nr:alpha-glucan family phosphorylase [Desulfobulbus oligotrophicus]MDY0391520.1 alpha-glucan family phosphorylase [Desulfobulbus oligotrophicus]QQG65565.1 alpha-glucan family phosphorylase [Desulfobulbus oligotrophicus]
MNLPVTTLATGVEQMICSNQFGTFFGVSQVVFDEVWNRLVDPHRANVAYISMEIGADPDVFHPVRDVLKQAGIFSSSRPMVNDFLNKYFHGPRKIPNYSGGLGVLAGDTLKSFADLHIPVFAISLLYREGYFSQFVDSKVGQIDHATRWAPESTPTLFQLRDPHEPTEPLTISVPFFNGQLKPTLVSAHVWMKLEISDKLDYFVPEFLIDYCLPGAPAWVTDSAHQLYNAKSTIIKANQRRMLGSAILPLLDVLRFSTDTIHLNEQHGATVILHLILQELQTTLGDDFLEQMTDANIITAAEKVSRKIVYTIHTPVKAGHDRFSRHLYSTISHSVFDRILNLLAHDTDVPHEYNFTAMAMRINRSINSVSRLHRDVTKKQFPEFGHKIKAITNGVHHLTWISDQRAACFDRIPSLQTWRSDPGCFRTITPECELQLRPMLQSAWHEDNRQLIQYVNNMLRTHREQMVETWIDPPNHLSNVPENEWLRPGVFTIGFARRFSTYKRADLILDDIARLSDILITHNWPVNFLFAGKAHPADEPGKSVLKLILDNQEELFVRSRGLGKLVFIPGYDMQVAKMMVSGVHAWLNNPKRPLEASGTSGMKAAMNGAPNISIMDGWWVEGYHGGQTGWKFGYEGPVEKADLSEAPDALLYTEDASAFYDLLPSILQTFYERPDDYMKKALNNLRLNIPIFNTHRMAAEYVNQYSLQLAPEVRDKIDLLSQLYTSEENASNQQAVVRNLANP